jgi:hypothetical protein
MTADIQSNREKRYWPMRAAILRAVPDEAPGISFEQLVDQITLMVDGSLFQAPRTIDWYARLVQLDLEARELLHRVEGATELHFVRTEAGATEARRTGAEGS